MRTETPTLWQRAGCPQYWDDAKRDETWGQFLEAHAKFCQAESDWNSARVFVGLPCVDLDFDGGIR